MSLARKVLSLILLLAILPATLHCDLENVGMLGADQCCAATPLDGGENQKCADFCDTLESKGFHFKKDNSIIFPAIISPSSPAFQIHASSKQPTFVQTDRTVVFECQRRWQFIQRTASLARSPSILS